MPALALALGAAAAHAQTGIGTGTGAPQAQASGAAAPGTSVQTHLSVGEIWTDNLRLTDRDKDAALITTVSPGVRIVRNSGMVRGTLDYTLNGIAYVKSDQPSQLQNSLQASGQAELVEKSVYVDAQASIGQQSVSAFGLQSVPTLGSQGSVSPLADPNRREVATLTVSPLWHGVVGGLASFDLRGNYARTNVRGDDLGDGKSTGGSLRLSGLRSGPVNGWALLSTQQTASSGVRSNRVTTATVGLNYQPDVDWLLGANVGRERNNYLAPDAQTGTTGGVSVQWTPSPRTHFNADWQHHDYGDSHTLAFEHRMSRFVVRVSDSQTVTVGNIGTTGSGGSVYDLYFLMFASLEPDLVKRDALVRAFLQSMGLSPDSPIRNGFLSSGPSQFRNQAASLAWQGQRAAVSLLASRSITRQLGAGLNEGDLASVGRIDQRTYSLTVSHQLTPNAGLSLIASRQEVAGDTNGLANQLNSLTANWNGKLGPRLGAQVGARHSRFGGVTSYSENAVYANLTQQY